MSLNREPGAEDFFIGVGLVLVKIGLFALFVDILTDGESATAQWVSKYALIGATGSVAVGGLIALLKMR
jgi:uncharacterized membrane protein YpjA